MTAPDLLHCPFCPEGKTVSTYFDHEQGDKWGYASCDACGARGPEVRTNYDRDDNAPWRAEAIAAWNTRATPAAMTPEVRALVDAVAVLLMQHDFENPMRQADYHGDICQCRRCRVDAVRAALAALRAGETKR